MTCQNISNYSIFYWYLMIYRYNFLDISSFDIFWHIKVVNITIYRNISRFFWYISIYRRYIAIYRDILDEKFSIYAIFFPLYRQFFTQYIAIYINISWYIAIYRDISLQIPIYHDISINFAIFANTNSKNELENPKIKVARNQPGEVWKSQKCP